MKEKRTDTVQDFEAVAPLAHEWLALSAIPGEFDADGNKYHESILRSWHLVNHIVEMLERRDSPETVLAFIRFVRSGAWPSAPLVVATKTEHYVALASEYAMDARKLRAAIRDHHDTYKARFGPATWGSTTRALYVAAGIIGAEPLAPAAGVLDETPATCEHEPGFTRDLTHDEVECRKCGGMLRREEFGPRRASTSTVTEEKRPSVEQA